MAEAKKQTAAPRSRTAKTVAPASTAKGSEQPAAKKVTMRSTPNGGASGSRISVTIPLDSVVAGVALKAATLPVTAAKKVAQNRNGIPAYVAVGGLAVIGAVEWPVAAVGGLSLAAMRRWGPLKPEQKPEPEKEPEPEKNA